MGIFENIGLRVGVFTGNAEKDLDSVTKALKKTARAQREQERASKSQQASNVKLTKGFGSLRDVAKDLGLVLSVGGIVYGAAAVLTDATKAALEFSEAMAEVNTLLPDSDNLAAVSEEVRRLSVEFNQFPVDQARALYQVISAGASNAAEASKILEVANRLAVGGVTDVATAADGLTSVLNAYGLSASEAGNVSDALFIAMKAGKTTIGEMSSSLGRVAPLAAKAGVGVDELVSATAALTKGGISTEESIAGLRAIMAAIIKPTNEAATMAESLGLQFNAAALESQGLSGFMDTLVEATGGSTEQMAQLFGGVEALVPALALAGGAGDDLNIILGEMGEKSGATGKAFDDVAGTDAFRLKKALGELQDVSIELGTAILEELVEPLELLAEHAHEIIDIAKLAGRIIGQDFGGAIRQIKDDMREAVDDGVAELVQAYEDAYNAAIDIPPALDTVAESSDRLTGSLKDQADAWEGVAEWAKKAVDEMVEALAHQQIFQTQTLPGIQGAGVGPDPSFGIDPRVFELFERLPQQVSRTADATTDWLAVLDPTIHGVVSLADNLFDLDHGARQALRGVSDLISGLENVQAGGVGSIGGVFGIIGGVASILGGIFSGSDDLAAQRAAEEEVRAAEEQARAAERFEGAVRRFEDAVGGSPDSLLAGFKEAMALLQDSLGTSTDFQIDQQALDLIELYLEKIVEITDQYREELEIRILLAQGMTEEAAARQLELAQRREMDAAIAAGWDEITLALLDSVHAAELAAIETQKVADAREREAEAARKLASFLADLEGRELSLDGDDRGALQHRLQSQADAELAAAQELLDAGIITQEMFDRLAYVLGEEVVRALGEWDRAQEEASQREIDRTQRDIEAKEEAGRRAEEAALRALEVERKLIETREKSRLVAIDDLEVRELLMAGDIEAAQIRKLEIRQKEELKRYLDLSVDQSIIDRVLAVQQGDMDNLLASFVPSATDVTPGGSSAIHATGSTDFHTSARTLSEVTGQRMSAIMLSQLTVLNAIEANTRSLRGGGGSLLGQEQAAGRAFV